MSKKLETALKAAGWETGDAADFLGMNPERRALLDLRVALATAIRARRTAQKLSQESFAAQFGTTQPRVSLIEAADSDVSLDQLARAFLMLGGSIRLASPKPKAGKARAPKRPRKFTSRLRAE